MNHVLFSCDLTKYQNKYGWNIWYFFYVQVIRADPTDNPLSNKEALSQTAVPLKPFKETHGGEDVALYAAGNLPIQVY